MIMVPRQDEIDAAQPLALVLPTDVMRQVTVIAALLSDSEQGPIQ
jgi:hypothetical protein